jgi:hypothetical protein
MEQVTILLQLQEQVLCKATANLITTGGTVVAFDSVTRDSATQITGVIAKSSLSNANEPYDVKVTNGSGLRSTLENQINIDAITNFNNCFWFFRNK